MSATLIGRIVGMAFLSGARPFLTIAMAQTIVMLAVYANWVSLHPDYAGLLSWPVVAAVFALAVVELVVAHDEDADEIKRLAQLDKVGAVAATAYGTLLMFAMGEPVPESIAGFSGATSAALAGAPGEVTSIVGHATRDFPPIWVQGLTVATAATFTLGLAWMRGYILDWLADVGLDRLWHLAETGGVPLAVALALFAPVLMLVIVVVATLLMAALAIGARTWQRHADARARVACPHCAHQVRGEASLCPRCRSRLTPTRWLGQEAAVASVAPVPAG